jgi:hypothetical protein
MNELTPQLAQLGDALEAAARADLERRRRHPLRRPSRRLAAVAAALAVLVPSAAIAADHLLSTRDVAASMPAGTLALAGTEPTCTVVREGVEYHCTLERAPAPEVADWTGTVEPTVDATKHVNGGCRGLNAAGTDWECYVGQEAVDQKLVSAGFLGAYAPSPGVG